MAERKQEQAKEKGAKKKAFPKWIIPIIVFALIELSLFTDVTLGNKEDKRIPTIQQVKASGYKKYTKDGVTSYRKE